MADLLGAGHTNEMQVLFTMKDGRTCETSGPAKGVSLLLQAEVGTGAVIAMGLKQL